MDNKQNHRGRFNRKVWGGASNASIFEWELLDTINCIYLPPLRDAEAKLREGRGSRLARLIKNITKKERDKLEKDGKVHPLQKDFTDFNCKLATDENHVISSTNKLIKEKLSKAIGSVFSQDTQIQFSENSFNRIVESLRLFFFPDLEGDSDRKLFRGLEENSLGYNNLLYLATVLAELVDLENTDEYLKLLLIEEPEAHLHPQLQIRLLKYLEQVASSSSIQVVVTTHSPVLASAASMNSIIHCACISHRENNSPPQYIATPLRQCGLSKKSNDFISRWLDVTKSTLLFAKGVILVEGIAEAMLLPIFARQILSEYNQSHTKNKIPKTLEDAGVSVINMNGIYFEHFMSLFCNLGKKKLKSLPLRCAGITDQDPPKYIPHQNSAKKGKPFTPIPSDIDHKKSKAGISKYKFPPQCLADEKNLNEPDRYCGKNPALELISKINASDNTRLYSGQLKTFEYDLAMEGSNLNIMLQILLELWTAEGNVKTYLKKLAQKNWATHSDKKNKAQAAYEVLRRIESNTIGKGLFAQTLAHRINSGPYDFAIPKYITEAVIWACGGELDDKA